MNGIIPNEEAPFRRLPQKGPDVSLERRPDGSILIWSNHAPAELHQTIAHLLLARSEQHPDTPFLRQRRPSGGDWRGVSYGEAARAAQGIGQSLLEMGLNSDDSVLILSSNSIEHALLMLGCYMAGVPAAPISPAVSLVSADHARLRHAYQVLRPRIVFAQDAEAFSRAFSTLRSLDPDIVFVTAEGNSGTKSLTEMMTTEPAALVEDALSRSDHSTTAKYLFTSGSTGLPKCVPQTHGMMCHLIAAQQGLSDPEPEESEPPQTLDWMPWSHISAGNITFNANLNDGGTLFIDEGKPLPGLFETTIRNLYDVSPTVFGSAPIAFGMLAAAMEGDPKLRKSFFRKLVYMGYGGATLSRDVNERLQALAVAETGKRIPMVTMYGATETQGVTVVHWATDRVGLIGLPVPGTVLKLAPSGDKLEVRAKGPTIAPRYHKDPERSDTMFDEEGYYRLGDAARFLDPEDPSQGLVFDGRLTEDFKLESGTWVSVGTLRPDVIAACSPLLQDAVIVGQDKPFAGLLAWPSQSAMQIASETYPSKHPHQALNALLADRLRTFNQHAGGSSRKIRRFMLLEEAPSIDAGEVTDKGYINQRAVIARRQANIDLMYTDPLSQEVIDIQGD